MSLDETKWAKVQLLGERGLAAEVLVPVDPDSGQPEPEVVVYQGRYFTGPNVGYGVALPQYDEAPWYAVPEPNAGQ